MKFTIIALSLCLITVLLFSCKTKQYTLEEYADPQITFGSGGGFTGMYKHYTLFKNGQLFKKEGKEEQFTAMKAADRNQVTQVFKNYQVLNLAEVEIDEPGNMTYYIAYKDKEGEHKMTWGGTNKQAAQEVKLFYQLLNQIVKTSLTEDVLK